MNCECQYAKRSGINIQCRLQNVICGHVCWCGINGRWELSLYAGKCILKKNREQWEKDNAKAKQKA